MKNPKTNLLPFEIGHIKWLSAGSAVFFSVTLFTFSSISLRASAALADCIAHETELQKIALLAAKILLCQLGLFVAGYVQMFFNTRCQLRLQYRCSNKVLYKLFTCQAADVLRINKSSFQYYIHQLSQEVTDSVFSLTQTIVNNVLTGILYIVCFRDVLPTTLLLGTTAHYLLLFLFTKRAKKWGSALALKLTALEKQINTSIHEILDNAASIRSCGIQENVQKRVKLLLKRQQALHISSARLQILINFVLLCPDLLFHLLVFLYVQHSVGSGASISVYFIVLTVATGFICRLKALFNVRTMWQKQQSLMAAFAPITALTKEGKTPFPTSTGIEQITVLNATYTYEAEKIIRYPDMRFDRPSFTLIQGPSGCGKTTLLRMLAGLLRPAEGSIEYDLRDHRHLPAKEGAGHVAYVPQNCFLFHASVRYNVTLGYPYSDTEIVQALQDANAYEFVVALPNGLDSVLHSDSLSGGQRQRIALARAILRRPSLLLLDESFANLDEQNRLEIATKLQAKDMICVAVSHQFVPNSILFDLGEKAKQHD